MDVLRAVGIKAMIPQFIFVIYSYISQALQHLLSKNLKAPSEETKKKVKRAFELVSTQEESASRVVEILQDISPDEDILNVVNGHGYDILQLSIQERKKSVFLLLLQKYGLVSRRCSPPLHIACFCGHADIVRILLDSGALATQMSGMCYPEGHKLVRYDQNLLGIVQTPIYRCSSNILSPAECAILADQVDCLKVLLEKIGCHTCISPLLHFACKKGASKCFSMMILRYPEMVDSVDRNGNTLLLNASPWGKKCIEILLDKGAMMACLNKHGEMALHKLYKYDIDGLAALYETTKYLLAAGMEKYINAADVNGETALHLLVGHVSYCAGNFVDTDSSHAITESQEQFQIDYQNQVVQCIDLLLKSNANPHLVNTSGLQPLNRMLHLALRACYHHDMFCCVQLDMDYVYKNNFHSLQNATSILLKHGADSNSQCQMGHTPLILFLQCLLHSELSDVCDNADDIIKIVNVLLRHGANPNFVASNQSTCFTLLAKICTRVFVPLAPLSDNRRWNVEFANLVNKILLELLKFGLNPNHTTNKRSSYLKGGTGNSLIEFVKLAELVKIPEHFVFIHHWIKTLLQWGADPDLEPYPSESIICHSQSSIFLKKQVTQAVSHYIYQVKESNSMFRDGYAERLFLLFYNTMDHKILYECLGTAKFMARFHPLGATGNDFLDLLMRVSENPRTLKQIARVSVYKSLSRQVALNIDKLPLPPLLMQYLLEIS